MDEGILHHSPLPPRPLLLLLARDTRFADNGPLSTPQGIGAAEHVDGDAIPQHERVRGGFGDARDTRS